jgi:xylulokinase
VSPDPLAVATGLNVTFTVIDPRGDRMTRAVVLGVDSGTQATKVLALDVESGDVVATGRASHSGNDIQSPHEWWEALRHAVQQVLVPDIEVQSISVAAQQHGCVLIDANGDVVRPAPLWNNTASAQDAERLNSLMDFVVETGSRLVASFTITKLAHIARTSPEDMARTAAVALPHDWLNYRLTGELTTDRGDASGTGWWTPKGDSYRRDLLAVAIGAQHAERIQLPTVRGPEEPAGPLSAEAAGALGLPVGIPVGPGTGDNMAAALGVGAEQGELIMSLGTSGTAFAVSDTPTSDTRGEVAGFADATGRYLPLTCMLNCTRVLDIVARLFGMERHDALIRAGAVAPGADGLILLPYFSGERTPNLPQATGTVSGLTTDTATPHTMVRAALDGVVAGLAYCVDALAGCGITAPRITLVGGGAMHPVWQQAVADATGLPVEVRAGVEHAARGAGVQAASLVRGESILSVAEQWRPAVVTEVPSRQGMRDAFALETRRHMIQEMMGRSN